MPPAGDASPLPSPLEEAVSRVASTYHRLVLLVGAPGTGKTALLQSLAKARGWPRINVNLRLSERLLELTERQRARRAPRVLSDICDEAAADTLILDNLEILFSPCLRLDPLRQLQALSRSRTIVAAWRGATDGGTLVYAEPGHPEHQRYTQPDVVILHVGRLDTAHLAAASDTTSDQ